MNQYKKYGQYFSNQLFNKNDLDMLILFVTSVCNQKCTTCFVHDRLNKPQEDLKFEEFEKISKKIGNFRLLLLSGGEPFISRDLVKLCSMFFINNNVTTLSIPTNASLTKKVLEDVETLLKRFPHVTISINASLDGLGERHDEIRKMKNAFGMAMKTLESLGHLREKYPNLEIRVNSVIHKDNFEEMEKLSVHLKKYKLNQHVFELMRGDPPSDEMKKIELDQAEKIHKFIVDNTRHYLDKEIKNPLTRILKKVSFLGSLNYIHHLKELAISKKQWPVECVAGKNIMIIYSNGDVPLCELRTVIGNVRDYDYNIHELLKTQKAKEQFNEAKTCSCTHICFINTTISKKTNSIFKIPLYYFKK